MRYYFGRSQQSLEYQHAGRRSCVAAVARTGVLIMSSYTQCSGAVTPIQSIGLTPIVSELNDVTDATTTQGDQGLLCRLMKNLGNVTLETIPMEKAKATYLYKLADSYETISQPHTALSVYQSCAD
jgi:hypothetical protein